MIESLYKNCTNILIPGPKKHREKHIKTKPKS